MALRRVVQFLFLLGASMSALLFGDLAPLHRTSETEDALDAPTTKVDSSNIRGTSPDSNDNVNINDGASALMAKMNANINGDSETQRAYWAKMRNNSNKAFVDESVMARPDEVFTFNATTESAPTCDAITADDVGFTLAVHMSYNRIHLMKRHCARWTGHPMSVSVGTQYSLTQTIQNLTDMGCPTDNKDFVVNAVKYIEGEDSYPVNTLRNIAMAGVKTTHLMLLDVDFVPSTDLHQHLMKHREALVDPKQTIVIPAFETGLSDFEDVSDDFPVPETKKALLTSFGYPGRWKENGRRKYIEQFFFNSQSNPGGHNSTNYTHWLGQSSLTLHPITCVASPRYEPYLVLRYCRDLPPYQESFTGYGKNKITWILQFMRSGYKLSQLGKGFVVHVPHAISADKGKWRKTVDHVGRETLLVEQVANAFYAWLFESVPDQTAVPECLMNTEPPIPPNPLVKKYRMEAFRKKRQQELAAKLEEQEKEQMEKLERAEAEEGEEGEAEEVDARESVPTRTNLDYVPGYFNADSFSFCRVSPDPKEGEAPVVMDNVPMRLKHQCAGDVYDRFGKSLESLIKDELSKPTRSKSPRWGKRTFLLPFLTPASYNRRQRAILIMGNSHTEQLVSTLLCQFSSQFVNRTVLYSEEEEGGEGLALQVQLSQNTVVYVVVNCPFLYSNIWQGTLEEVLQRSLNSFDAIVVGSFVSDDPQRKKRMLILQGEHPDWDIDFNNRGPSVVDVAATYRGAIFWAGMFSESADTEHKRTLRDISLLKTNNSQNRTNVRSVDSRRFIRKLKSQYPDDASTAVDECAADDSQSLVSTCVTDTSVARYSEGHRCTGASGGHPDFVVWDLLELIHQELTSARFKRKIKTAR